MDLRLVDTTDTNHKQICEIEKNACITSGYDHVKFTNPVLGISGDAGFSLVKDYWYAPAFNSETTGTLDNTKFYSIRLQPITSYISDPNSGEFLKGTATHFSDPVQPSTTSIGLVFDIQSLLGQKTVFYAGYSTGGTASTLEDYTRDWVADAFIGYQVVNVRNGLVANITDSDGTTLTIDTDIEVAIGDGYHIVKPMCTEYLVYACELDAAIDVLGGSWILQGALATTETQYTLSSFVSGGLPLVDNNFPPDPYYACTVDDNRMIAGGGIYDTTGEAIVDESIYSMAASAGHEVAVTKTMDLAVLATKSGTHKIFRYTFASADDYMPYIRSGSIATIAASTASGNDAVDAVITRVASDGSWFEIANATGAADAADATMTVSIMRNVLVGNVSGTGMTMFRKGMVGGRFRFGNDSKTYQIAWVDEEAQEIGLYEKYTDSNTKEIQRGDILPTTWPNLVKKTVSPVNERVLYNVGQFDFSTSTWTVAFWVKCGATTNPNPFMFVTDSGVSEYYKFYWINNTSIYMNHQIGSTQRYAAWGIAKTTDYTHIALTVDFVASQIKLYVNGELKTTTSNTFFLAAKMSIAKASTYFIIPSGTPSAGFGDYRIYSDVKTQEEVVSIMNKGTLPNLVERYKLDEGTGDTCLGYVGGSTTALSYGEAGNTSHYVPITAITGLPWIVDYDWGIPDVVIENDIDHEISTSYGLAWSDSNNPHVFRTENYTPVSDSIMAIAVYNSMVLLFCKNSLQRVPLQALGQLPSIVSNTVRCVAPHSVVTTPSGVFFFDGSGISLTDGQQILPVTAYKANEYMKSINRSMEYNIRGTYDPNKRRVDFAFPFGSSVENNYGLSIGIDSMNCYPFQRLDMNALWTDWDETGDLTTVHGTTNRIGDAVVWSHDTDMGTDGEYTTDLVGNVTLVSGNTVSVQFGVAVTDTVSNGDIALYVPKSIGVYRQVRIVSFALKSGETTVYDAVIDPDEDVSDFEVGGFFIVGGVPFDYGIKWMDFSSPQYKHKVRQLHIDVTDFNGVLFVEHYKDMKDIPVYYSMHYVNESMTKIVASNNLKASYFYGFRIWGVSLTRFGFHSFEVVFDPEV